MSQDMSFEECFWWENLPQELEEVHSQIRKQNNCPERLLGGLHDTYAYFLCDREGSNKFQKNNLHMEVSTSQNSCKKYEVIEEHDKPLDGVVLKIVETTADNLKKIFCEVLTELIALMYL